MHIEVMDYTPDPIDLISKAMGVCYGKSDSSEKRVKRAFTERHMSVFEHAKVTVRIDGISRACANQLVRHRMASYCQESQRYCKIDTGVAWYVTPPTMEDEKGFKAAMDTAAFFYQKALEAGIPAEDARYMLPSACKTAIVMTMNARELYHFFELRDEKHAQWEIRGLAQALRKKIHAINGQWTVMMGLDKEDDRA